MSTRHKMLVEHEDDNGNLTDWYIWFYYYPSGGDGYNEPRYSAFIEFDGVTDINKLNIVPTEIREWAETELESRKDEALSIAEDDHEYWRDYAAELKANR